MSLILNRRGFLIAGRLTVLASAKAFGANERLRVGVIGAGRRMKSVLSSADQSGVPFEIVSVCDVYAPRCAEIKARGNAATSTGSGFDRNAMAQRNCSSPKTSRMQAGFGGNRVPRLT
jgi:hypothetical protein